MKLRIASVSVLSCLLMVSVGAGCVVNVENVINQDNKKDAASGDTAAPEDVAPDAPATQDIIGPEDINASDAGPSDVFVEPDVVSQDAAEEDATVDEPDGGDVMSVDVTETDAMGDATPEALIEIAGSWETDYGELFDINDESWGPSSMHAFDNDENWAITQYPEDDPWSPNLFAKSVWTEVGVGGYFWQCTLVYDAQTFEEAAASEASADDADPANMGCTGFPWTQYGPVGGFE